MATTWAATASNEAVTRAALQDAINTNVLNFGNTFIPNTDVSKCINMLDGQNYAFIDYPTGSATNQLLTKNKYIVSEQLEYGLAIGGRRDGSNVTVFVTNSFTGNTLGVVFESTTCSLSSVFRGDTGGTLTVIVKNTSNQQIKFWMTEGGTTCPTGGTEYDSIVYTPTSKRNFLIVPVWTGSSYVLV